MDRKSHYRAGVGGWGVLKWGVRFYFPFQLGNKYTHNFAQFKWTLQKNKKKVDTPVENLDFAVATQRPRTNQLDSILQWETLEFCSIISSLSVLWSCPHSPHLQPPLVPDQFLNQFSSHPHVSHTTSFEYVPFQLLVKRWFLWFATRNSNMMMRTRIIAKWFQR